MSHKPHFNPVGRETGTKQDWAQDVRDELLRVTGDRHELATLERMAHADLRALAGLLSDVPSKVAARA